MELLIEVSDSCGIISLSPLLSMHVLKDLQAKESGNTQMTRGENLSCLSTRTIYAGEFFVHGKEFLAFKKKKKKMG